MIQTFSDTNDLLTFNGQERKKGTEIGGDQQLAEDKIQTQPTKHWESGHNLHQQLAEDKLRTQPAKQLEVDESYISNQQKTR